MKVLGGEVEVVVLGFDRSQQEIGGEILRIKLTSGGKGLQRFFVVLKSIESPVRHAKRSLRIARFGIQLHNMLRFSKGLSEFRALLKDVGQREMKCCVLRIRAYDVFLQCSSVSSLAQI